MSQQHSGAKEVHIIYFRLLAGFEVTMQILNSHVHSNPPIGVVTWQLQF